MKLQNTLFTFGENKEIIHPIPNPIYSIMIWVLKEKHTKPHGTCHSTTKSSHTINKQINQANSKQWVIPKIFCLYLGTITTCPLMNCINKRQNHQGKRSVESCLCVLHKSEGCAHGSRQILLFWYFLQIGCGCTQITGHWTELVLALILSWVCWNTPRLQKESINIFILTAKDNSFSSLEVNTRKV